MVNTHTNKDVAFVAAIESGLLEKKFVMLAESIRMWGGKYRKSPIMAVQPRQGKTVSKWAQNKFSNLDVTYVYAPSKSNRQHYDLGNKIYAAGFAQEYFRNKVDRLVLLDCDTLILDEPMHLTNDESIISLRPVDYKGVGLSCEESIDEFWQYLYDICNVNDFEPSFVKTNVTDRCIKPYFNSGVVSIDISYGIFTKWVNVFEEIVKKSPKFFTKKQQHFIEQSLLTSVSLSVAGSEQSIHILPIAYNYPYHVHSELPNTKKIAPCNVCVLHYHTILDDRIKPVTGFTNNVNRTINKYIPLSGVRAYLKKPFKYLGV